MTEILTAAQMRAIEVAAIASGAVTGLALMERAGGCVVRAIFDEWPDLGAASHRAVVLCGPGNNGGDGFVVARLLHDRGWTVEVYLYGRPEGLPPDALANYRRWCAFGDVYPFAARKTGDTQVFDVPPDLWVDAIFGIGQTRPLPDQVTDMLARVAQAQIRHRAPVVAVDVPTGLNADTGASVQAVYLTADLTATFHTLKPGHLSGDGPARCGKVVVCDIGLSGACAQGGTL